MAQVGCLREGELSPTRILLLDDHPAVLDGLAGYLDSQSDMAVVGRFVEAPKALAELVELNPDIAIVDIKIGGGFTFEFCEQAKALLPDLRLMFITGYDDDVFFEKAFQVGGQGFVLKSEPLTELTDAIKSLMSGERYLSTAARQRFAGAASTDEQPVAARLSLLTPREREVLKYVSMGMSAKEISKLLKISSWTVTNHKANIMGKLNIHNQVGLARFAMVTGLANNI